MSLRGDSKPETTPDPWDGQFLKSSGELTDAQPDRPSGWSWVVVAVLAAAAAVALYVAFGGRLSPGGTPPAERPKPIAAAVPVQPLGGAAPSIDLPPLNESDALVRQLVRQLSSHPQVAAWLATNDLIRNFTLIVTNIVEGQTLAPVLPALRPSSAFRVTEQSHNLYIDPRSYERYAGFTGAVASIEPAGSAKLYTMLKPRIEEAYVELGHRNTPFDRTFERAIVLLLNTPVQDGLVRVEPGSRGIGYVFAKGPLEALAVAQKQLLRMGPEHARTIQQRLREIALALGIPAERLPAPGTQAAAARELR